MKILVDRQAFAEAFSIVSAIAPRHSPKPILSSVKLIASGKACTLLATDLEIGIRLSLPAEVGTGGEVMLPAERVGAILKCNSDAQLRIVATKAGIVITGDRCRFELPASDPQDFPTVAEFGDAPYVELPAGDFKTLVKRTEYCTDETSSRYALGGVKLEFHNGKLLGIATDGRRLAKHESRAAAVGEVAFAESLIVPARAMRTIGRALPGDETTIKLSPATNHILVQAGDMTIYARLLEGRFPRWSDVFPRRLSSAKISLSVAALLSAVKQAAIATSEESRGVLFSFAEGTATLTGKAAEVGQSHVEFPITYTEAERKISLDPRYVADFLRILDAEANVTLDIDSADAAAVLSFADSYGYVIMPLSRG